MTKQEHRVALSGASGMLGRAILKELGRRDDVAVLAFYRKEPSQKCGAKIENRLVDLFQTDQVKAALSDFHPTVFIHSAATGMQHPLPDPGTLSKVNVQLPLELARAVSAMPDCRFVHISSGLAYKEQNRPLREEDPLGTLHPYGASKVEAEKRLQALAHERPFDLTIIRPFSFTGEGDFGSRLFPSLLRSAVEKQLFVMSSGKQVRDHSSVNDIARGVVNAALHPSSRKLRFYNLGGGDLRPVRDLVRSVISELELKVEIRLGAKPAVPYEPMFVVADCTRARIDLRWSAQESVAHAVWELARTAFPSLELNEPMPK